MMPRLCIDNEQYIVHDIMYSGIMDFAIQHRPVKYITTHKRKIDFVFIIVFLFILKSSIRTTVNMNHIKFISKSKNYPKKYFKNCIINSYKYVNIYMI